MGVGIDSSAETALTPKKAEPISRQTAKALGKKGLGAAVGTGPVA